MTHTKTEAVSDERLRKLLLDAQYGASSQPGVAEQFKQHARDTVSILTELLSRRAANSAGGVRATGIRLEQFGPDENVIMFDTGEEIQPVVLDDENLAKLRSAIADPFVEAEPVAWLNGEREIMLGWFRRYIDEQYSCGQVDDGMRLERLHKLLSGSSHPSSPVSAEVTVTDEMVEMAHRAQMSELFVLCQPKHGNVFAFMDDRKDVMRAALLAALNGGRENG